MALKTITPVDLDPNVRSIDLIGGGTTVDPADTFTIPVLGNTRTIILVLEELNTGAATVTFNAGDNPPSFLSESLDIALAQADLRVLMFEPGQFIQDDQSGSITGSVATNDIKMYALRISNAI